MTDYKITGAQKELIEQVESTELLAERFKNLRCVNINEDGVRHGVLSIVFCADDILEDRKVAVKFFDPDRLGDKYRLAAFEREPELVSRVSHKDRCLSLVSGVGAFDLSFKGMAERELFIKMPYFVTDWIEYDIEDQFDRQTEFSPREKLSLFRHILLSVFSVHRESIFHRDIKKDNLRRQGLNDSDPVILIDFGTAARLESEKIQENYEGSVGASGYSAPEALAGLAAVRSIAHLTDIYAMGCLLFELFNLDYFYTLMNKNLQFRKSLIVLNLSISREKNEGEKLAVWNSLVNKFKIGLEPPTILQEGNSCPPSISRILERLHRSMTQFDFNDRNSDFDWLLRQVDICIRNLDQHAFEEHLRRRRAQYRQNRINKLRAKQLRLNSSQTEQSALV